MKKYMFIVLAFVFGLSIGISTRLINLKNIKYQQTPQTPSSPSPEQEEAKLREKYVVNIPAKYFDVETFEYGGTYTLRELFSSEPVEPIAFDENIKVLNEIVPENKCEGPGECPKYRYTTPIDVDNDRQKEKILRIFRGVNHGVEDLYIVKNNRVIFKVEDSPVQIEASKSNNGFYLTYYFNTFLGVIGKVTKIRYIHDSGKFIPVWQQISYELQTIQP